MRRALPLTACLAVLAAAPAPAAAVEPGVHVDPGSPAGKEYALPLERARREAAGGGGDPSSSGGSTKAGGPQLFGEGIKKKGRGRAGGRSAGDRSKREAGTPERLGVPASVSPGGSGTLTDVGIALAVLAAAGALGLGLRRALR